MGAESGHPASWRLFRAHPALGLDELDGDVLWSPKPTPRELGVAWLALDAAEQRRREADLAAALEAAGQPGSGFEVELVRRDDPPVLGVWMDRWKAPALERELLDRVWEEARRREATGDRLPERRRRELDRTLRAHVLIAWDRHAFKAFVAAMALAGLLGLHPWGDKRIGDVALRVAVAVAVVIALGGVINRWYERSQRKADAVESGRAGLQAPP